MADMSFTEARIALEQFANFHKAAIRLGEALEAAVNLEKQSAMLKNNVEHLLKEQAAQQKRLDDMVQSEKDMSERIKKDHDRMMAALEVERQSLLDQIRATKEAAAAEVAAELASHNDRVNSHNAQMQSLMADRRREEEYISKLTKQADDIKAKMRKFVN